MAGAGLGVACTATGPGEPAGTQGLRTRMGPLLSRPCQAPRFKKAGRRMAVDVPQASALNITRLSHRWGELSIPSSDGFDSAGPAPCPVCPAAARAELPALG
jgi:hypothetical protein